MTDALGLARVTGHIPFFLAMRSAFLIESIFTEANLKAADFSGAYIRNVRFDEFLTRSFRTRPTPVIGRKQEPVFSFDEHLMETQHS